MYNYLTLKYSIQLIVTHLIPNLLSEKLQDTKVRQPLACIEFSGDGCETKEPHFSDKFCFKLEVRLNLAESPSQSRPGSPHCCCADSSMEDAVVVSWTEAASQLRHRETWTKLAHNKQEVKTLL